MDFSIYVDNNDTLCSIFQKRVKKSPDAVAYYQFDQVSNTWVTYTWGDCADLVDRYRQAMLAEGLVAGDRVAVMLHNCVEWIVFDQAAASLGLVTVPLFSEDNANNCSYIMLDAGVRLLFVGNQRQLQKVQSRKESFAQLERIVCCEPLSEDISNQKIVHLPDWLATAKVSQSDSYPVSLPESSDTLATLVYTSGTTGRPKGVMLSHRSIVANILAVNQIFDFGPEDILVSFLPLSHIFERVVGYYVMVMMGARVAYARSFATLLEDINYHRPTVLLSVPSIYERIYTKVHQQFSSSFLHLLLRVCVAIGYRHYQLLQSGKWKCWIQPLRYICEQVIAKRVRATLGGNIRCAVSGGAPMPADVSRLFLACGVPLYQGYGLTESSPVVSVNLPKSNLPESIGVPLPGIEVRIDEKGELLTRSACVMQGYWGLPEATTQAIDTEGWLHTGDLARMDKDGRLFITGRIKEIIVMSNGEKVPPADIEMVIVSTGLVSQVMVYGESCPFLIALVVPTEEMLAQNNQETLAVTLRKSIAGQLKDFPAYARIRQVLVVETPWTVENGMLTPTLKLKRQLISKQYQHEIESIYQDFR